MLITRRLLQVALSPLIV